ncbi:MAG TPA: hypothetical protein VF522_08730 [Ramlibacter sp.]|uniref:hypothetical protein n=1 Tax=Ramlibacter sp. TaxID=1917967 RepID=UPI002ED32C90
MTRCTSLLLAGLLALPAMAATSAGCEGGGFTVLGHTGVFDDTIPASSVPARFTVVGKFQRFEVVAATFAIENHQFLPTNNPLDMTSNMVTPVWASKTPDHRGLVLNSGIELSIDAEVLELQRLGPGLSMKIQAKDCANGGVFQMEPERADGTETFITHTLANAPGSVLQPFYFDNPNFRAREGDTVPYKDTTVVVTARINIANDFSPRFVARDSPQVARRISEAACTNRIATRTGGVAIVQHCGGRSIWAVASGGRMGFVTGEDAIEVAPPAAPCTSKCQAQNRVRGQSVKLGFPFPVPGPSRLQPRFP